MNELEKKSEVASQLTRLHRGVWGTLENDMELPIGGSILSNELTTSLKLDFSNFPEFATQEKIDELYENGRLRYEEWFAQLPAGLRSAISPREFFTLCLVQNGMEMRLGVKSEFPPETEMARTARYSSEMPLLSDFRGGISHCGERSALGQWLLQKVGIPSVYMGGVRFWDILENGEEHSWIVLWPDTDRSLVFDIAAPEVLDQSRMPNLYAPEVPLSAGVFTEQTNAFVKSEGLWRKDIRYFGVSDSPVLTHETARIITDKVSGILE